MASKDFSWANFIHPGRPGEVHVAPLWNRRPPSRDLTTHDFYDPCWCDYSVEVGSGYFLIIHEELQKNTFLTP